MTVNRQFLREFLRIALIALLALACYRWLAGTLYRSQSIAPHFVTLADAFLHGKTNLPGEGYDLILYQEQWYVAQPPLPALLLMPAVAIFGAGFSDILASIMFGAVGVVGCTLVLKTSVPELGMRRRMLLTLGFGLGTVYAVLAAMGTVWFLGQVVAVLCLWGYIWSVHRRFFWLAGLFLGGIFLARPFIVPGALVYVGLFYYRSNIIDSLDGRTRYIMSLLKLGVGLGLAVAFMGTYNAVRFGSPLEFGYQYIQDAPNIREKREAHGIFSPVFFPENLYVATVKPINIHPKCLTDTSCGFFEPDLEGAGILWTSPFLLYMFFARSRNAEESHHIQALAVASMLCILPPLFYHNTGSAQFGYRFLLDALPFMMLLTAYGARRGKLWLLAGIIFVCVVINLWGARWFIDTIYGI